jgi:hypothetical protein
MRLVPTVEISRIQRRIVSSVSGFAVALTVVHLSAARKDKAARTR